jgi:hypothetical protein
MSMTGRALRDSIVFPFDYVVADVVGRRLTATTPYARRWSYSSSSLRERRYFGGQEASKIFEITDQAIVRS